MTLVADAFWMSAFAGARVSTLQLFPRITGRFNPNVVSLLETPRFN